MITSISLSLHLLFLVVLKLLAVFCTTNAPSHDCFTRLLQKQPSNTEPLWAEVRKFVTLKDGFLIVDDTVLDKPYSEKIGFVRHQWSGKHHRTVKGIGLVTMLWTDGNKILPIDFRIYNIGSCPYIIDLFLYILNYYYWGYWDHF